MRAVTRATKEVCCGGEIDIIELPAPGENLGGEALAALQRVLRRAGEGGDLSAVRRATTAGSVLAVMGASGAWIMRGGETTTTTPAESLLCATNLEHCPPQRGTTAVSRSTRRCKVATELHLHQERVNYAR